MSDIQLNVAVVDPGGNPIPGAIRTLFVFDASGKPCPIEPAIRIQDNFYSSPKSYQEVLDEIYKPGTFHGPFTAYGKVEAVGFQPAYISPEPWGGAQTLLLQVTLGFSWPGAIDHSPLPAFDPSDAYGQVHTTLPPEQVIPPPNDLLWLRADFNGVTLDDGDPTPPILIGANTTPVKMLMSPMLPMYPETIQQVYLTRYCQRGYSHFVVAAQGWNFDANDFLWSPADFTAWCRMLKSRWGRKVVYWGTTIMPDPYLEAAVAGGVIDFHIVGEEVDTKVTAEQYQSILTYACGIGPSIPRGAHFTDNYPEGFPRDTFLTNWADWNGRVHLMWQANQNDTAGKQGAMSYYARLRVSLGQVGGDGRPAPDSRVIAFETMASNQLAGKCTEAYGNLRSWELLCTTRTDDRVRPISGFGNGCRYPTGQPI